MYLAAKGKTATSSRVKRTSDPSSWTPGRAASKREALTYKSLISRRRVVSG